MSVPAQPSIDALEASLATLQGELATIKAENESLKQQVASGALTDVQAAKLKSIGEAMAEAILGKQPGPSAS